MKFTKRDKMVLAVFAVLIVAVCVVVAKKMTTSGGPSGATARASTESPSTSEADRPSDKSGGSATSGSTGSGRAERPPTFPNREYEEFAAIPERNLFRDPTVKEEKKPARAAPTVPTVPTPGPLPPPSTESASVSSPPEETVAVTGFMTMGDERLALVENVTTKETRLVREGAEAFGHVVASVSPEGATLRKGDDERYFALGNGKPDEEKKDEKKDEKKGDDGKKKEEEKKAESTPPAPSPGPSSPGGGFDFRNLTSQQREEFRRRWEDRRRSRR